MNIKEARELLYKLNRENMRRLRIVRDMETDDYKCICTRCGHSGTGKEFSAPTGGDDYDGQCPNCWAPDDYIRDIDE